MARFTGTIGNPSVDAAGNKIVKPIGEPIDIVFYAKGKTPIIRTTEAGGKYDFTLVNGSYQVSMYLSALPEAFRIRADLRDGEFFVVATNSPTSAFQEWIDTAVDASKPEDNPIIKRIQGQLDAMQVILDQFRDETQQDGTGKFVMQSSVAKNFLSTRGSYLFKGSANDLPVGDIGLYNGSSASNSQTTDLPNSSLNQVATSYIFNNGARKKQTAIVYTEPRFALRVTVNNDNVWTKWAEFYSNYNTTIDSNGFIKAASPIIKLFNDRIETNDQFIEEPIFEKIGVGTYKISNTLGLAKDGWTYEKPRGSDGNPYFRIKVEKLEDGCIITVHDEYVDYEDKEIIDSEGNKRTVKERVTVLSAARDIKDHERWIDLRFHEELKEEVIDEELHSQSDNLN